MSLHVVNHRPAVVEAYGACIKANDMLEANVGRSVLESSAALMRRAFDLFANGETAYHATQLYDIADSLQGIVQAQNPELVSLDAKGLKKKRADTPQELEIDAA